MSRQMGFLPASILTGLVALGSGATASAFPLARLVPEAPGGTVAIPTAPPVIGNGISNATEVFGVDFQGVEDGVNRAGIFVARTSADRAYDHNRKTCRLVADGATLVGIFETPIGGGQFYDILTWESAVLEHATQFVVRQSATGVLTVDSRYLSEEYPSEPGALETLSVQVWSPDALRMISLTEQVLAKLAGLGSLEFANTAPMRLPTVSITRASHFVDRLRLRVANDAPDKELVTFEAHVTKRPDTEPEVLRFERSLEPGQQTASLNVGQMSGIVLYSMDATGFRDQIYVGRGFGYFGDAHAGGRTIVLFDDRTCGTGAMPVQGSAVLFPGCGGIEGTVDKWAGMYLPVGSYVGEVVDLPAKGYEGFEFWARSAGPFRLQVEDPRIRDFDFHGKNLNGDGTWKRYRVSFHELTQRGFGARAAFTGKVIQLSWLIDPPDGALVPFDIEVDQILLVPKSLPRRRR